MNKTRLLVDMLEACDKKELQTMAHAMGVESQETKPRSELISELKEILFDEQRMKFVFLHAMQFDIEAFEQRMKEVIKIKAEDERVYRYFIETGYCYVTSDHELIIPKEIKEQYEKMKQDDWYQEERAYATIIEQYMDGAVNLYGAVSLKFLADLINQQTTCLVTPDELMKFALRKIAVRGDQIYSYDEGSIFDRYYEDEYMTAGEAYHLLLELQGDKPYYIPSQQVLFAYGKGDYIEENDSFKAMKKYLCENGMNLLEAKQVTEQIQRTIRTFGVYPQIVANLERSALPIKELLHQYKFTMLLEDMFENTRVPENRGFTIKEINSMRRE